MWGCGFERSKFRKVGVNLRVRVTFLDPGAKILTKPGQILVLEWVTFLRSEGSLSEGHYFTYIHM
jgi:hypothetical protein